MVSRKESGCLITSQLPVLQPSLPNFSMQKRRFSSGNYYHQRHSPASLINIQANSKLPPTPCPPQFVDCWKTKSPNKSNRRRRRGQQIQQSLLGSLASSCSLTSIASSTSSGIDSSSSSTPKVGDRDNTSPPNSSTASSLGFEDDQELQSLNKEEEDEEDFLQDANLPNLAALQLDSPKANNHFPTTYYAHNNCLRTTNQHIDLDFSNPTVQRYFEEQKQFYRQIYDQQFAACRAGKQPAFAPPNFVRPNPRGFKSRSGRVRYTPQQPIVKSGGQWSRGQKVGQPPHQHLGLPPMPPPSLFAGSNANLVWNNATEHYWLGQACPEPSGGFCNGAEDKSKVEGSSSEGCSKECTPIGTVAGEQLQERDTYAQHKDEECLQNVCLPEKKAAAEAFQVSRMDVLSEQILNFHEGVEQTPQTLSRKLHLRDMLYYAISPMFPMCGLYVVGSSLNGFGNDKSDMDLCLMITNRDIDQQNDAVMVLSSIMHTLQNTMIVADQQLILAKVPILRIKFNGAFSDITVDLNANNSVAIRNTHLLCYYSTFDWRVRPLVSVVKEWAKRRGINDANRSSFTSYSLVLMVIHYLQVGTTQTPVLPSLQHLYPNVFHKNADVRNLNVGLKLSPAPETLWESNHKLTLSELLLGFLQYYAFKFSFDADAISIRIGRKTGRAMVARNRSPYNHLSQWHCICIEEPFILSNTAHSVYDERIFEAIKKAFINGFQELELNRDLTSFLSPANSTVQTC